MLTIAANRSWGPKTVRERDRNIRRLVVFSWESIPYQDFCTTCCRCYELFSVSPDCPRPLHSSLRINILPSPSVFYFNIGRLPITCRKAVPDKKPVVVRVSYYKLFSVCCYCYRPIQIIKTFPRIVSGKI